MTMDNRFKSAFRELLPSERMFSEGVITPPPMSKEQRENLRLEWEKLHTGLVNVSHIRIWEEGHG